jgi:hypothetical protein
MTNLAGVLSLSPRCQKEGLREEPRTDPAGVGIRGHRGRDVCPRPDAGRHHARVYPQRRCLAPGTYAEPSGHRLGQSRDPARWPSPDTVRWSSQATAFDVLQIGFK